MIRLAIITGFVAQSTIGWSQTASQLIQDIWVRFEKVQDLKCQVDMNFDIPGVSIENIRGKLFYKKPNKFRIHTKGLIFLPKQNPFQQLELLEDPSSYVAILAGESVVNGITCRNINVIPNKPDELVIMRLMVGKEDGQIHKSELTLKREGTVTYYNSYNSSQDIIPTVMKFEADFRRFKMPKALSGDFSSTPVREDENQGKYETGRVTMSISALELNRKIDDKVFTESLGL
jgi:outer membrane lipoprotein-sorting protein